MKLASLLLICGTMACLTPVFVNAEDSPADAKRRDALRKQEAELQAAAAAEEASREAAIAADSAEAAKLREALRARFAEDDAREAKLREEERARIEAEKAREAAAKAPPQAPPPGPVTKSDRLAQLLKLYQADEITAAEYHRRRSGILAE